MDEQQKLLDDALGVVKTQAYQMKGCLEANRLMDGLKHCSTMLAELRTSSLTPKIYYELYMSIFDSLRYLTTYLKEAHASEKHHLADLYELVQYAGNILPRLYLMITVGSVYMAFPGAPVKELMHDMMEMARGIQHPTRGLFLRHYLSGMTRDALPLCAVEDSSSISGTLNDSIDFVLTNFTEMNKLWVRLQHLGHSREREKREMERKDLRLLVGTNILRFSQLEGVDLPLYLQRILPGILEQVVTCNDVIAQEYLMEVIIQVFPDDFHLRTLAPYLEATTKLHPKVNVRQTVIRLIDRVKAYAACDPENETNWDLGNTDESGDVADGLKDINIDGRQEDSAGAGKVERRRGIPEDVKLFEVFWEQTVKMVQARPDMVIQDITALLNSLLDLSLSCYPTQLKYVDQILQFTNDRADEAAENYSADLHSTISMRNILALLLAPVREYAPDLTLLKLNNYNALLDSQPFPTRHTVALAVVNSIINSETIVESPEDVDGILTLCGPLIRDPKDAYSPSGNSTGHQTTKAYEVPSLNVANGSTGADDQRAEEPALIAKFVHFLKSDDPDRQQLLLAAARKQFGDGGYRIQYTLPPVVFESFKLARRYKALEGKDESWETKCSTLLHFIHQMISVLYSKSESHEMSFRLFLTAGQIANDCRCEEMAYDFFVQAFTIYEDSISESKSQFMAITLFIGTLQTINMLPQDKYDALITKCTLHASKLLKKPDQCRAILLCSHLFWAVPKSSAKLVTGEGAATGDKEDDRNGSDATGYPGEREKKEACCDAKRVLGCLQKALKIADSCMDMTTNVELFVEILNSYIYFYETGNKEVTGKHLNGLIDLINTNISNFDASDVQQSGTSSSSALIEHIAGGGIAKYLQRHFRSTLLVLRDRKEQRSSNKVAGPRYEDVDISFILSGTVSR